VSSTRIICILKSPLRSELGQHFNKEPGIPAQQWRPGKLCDVEFLAVSPRAWKVELSSIRITCILKSLRRCELMQRSKMTRSRQRNNGNLDNME
jgi:hypothetical protein